MFKIFGQIGRDTVILGIGTISTSALGFILMPLYTRVFSTEEYGIIMIVNISAQMVGIIMALGIPSAFDREFLQLSDTEEKRKEVISTSFLFTCVFSFFIGVIAFALSDKLALFLELYNPMVPNLFRLIFIKIFFSTLGLITLRYMIVTGKMAIFSFLSFLLAAFIMLISLWVLLIQKDDLYELYFYQTIVVAIFGLGYSVFIFYYAGFRWSGKRLRSMLFFALPMVPSAISYYIMTSSDRFFLQKLTSTSDVGVYGAAYKVGSLLLLIVGPLTASISPFIYRIVKRDDSRVIFQHLFEIMSFILFACALCLSLASPYLIRILAPPTYWSASAVVIWVTIAYALYGLNFILVAGINISGKSYYQMIAIAIAAILNLILNSLLIPYWGITGAAIATTIAYFCQTLLNILFAQRLYPIPYRFIRTSAIACIIIISYWLLNLVPLEPFMVSITIKSVVFILLLSGLSILFFREEVFTVWRKIKPVFVSKLS